MSIMYICDPWYNNNEEDSKKENLIYRLNAQKDNYGDNRFLFLSLSLSLSQKFVEQRLSWEAAEFFFRHPKS
jgi:hypothetical protein